MLLSILIILIEAVIVVTFASLTVMVLVYLERKISGHFQVRYGPMRVGWHGALQLIADTIKLLMKEDTTPRDSDKWVFFTAPILAFVAAYLAYYVIPFAPGIVIKDLNIGLLYIFGITTLTVLSILMAGWASSNKYALLGGFRSVAQIVSYEIPIILAVIPVVMAVGSLSLVKIVEAQSVIPFIVYQPVSFLIYFIAATAEINRTPFDIPEAESELVAGYNVEYSGIKFSMFFFAEFVNMFTVCAIAAILFLGGWNGPILPPIIWFFIKSYFLVFILFWVKWTYPRLRVDQLMSFCWKILLPLAFVNLLIIGAWMVIR